MLFSQIRESIDLMNRGHSILTISLLLLLTGPFMWSEMLEVSNAMASDVIADADGFRPIFNGVDMAGWTGDVNDYEVRDAAIVCKAGKGGVLFTEETYQNFAVRLEFKLPPGGNNGLAIRYPGKGRASYAGMCELQVLDDSAAKYAKLDARQFHGSAYGIAAAKTGFLKPVGEWNHQQVTVVGSVVTVVLNGHEILNADMSQVREFKDNSPHPGLGLTQGHFGFCGHNDPVMYRNISIKRLPAPASFAVSPAVRNKIGGKLVFHSTFDDTTDANLSTGDGRVFTASSPSREKVSPGNQMETVRIAKGEGKFRDALKFSGGTDGVLFYPGVEFGFREQDWTGTVSFWLQLDPNKDLEPGYCDPIQITERTWNDAAFFVDFDKTLPRDFRLGVFPDVKTWNPGDTKWEDVPASQRPMVTVKKPPFAADKWTHVCFTWEGINPSETSNATCKLFLDGELQGTIRRPMAFTWDLDKVAMMIGIQYIGLIDDLAIFKSPLSPEEVKIIFDYPMGISYL